MQACGVACPKQIYKHRPNSTEWSYTRVLSRASVFVTPELMRVKVWAINFTWLVAGQLWLVHISYQVKLDTGEQFMHRNMQIKVNKCHLSLCMSNLVYMIPTKFHYQPRISAWQHGRSTYHLCSERQCKVVNNQQNSLQPVQECCPVKRLTVTLKVIVTSLKTNTKNISEKGGCWTCLLHTYNWTSTVESCNSLEEWIFAKDNEKLNTN